MNDPGFTVSDYLIARLRELQVGHLFTIPGDYFAPFLDRVDVTPGIERVATSNELEAGFAADAYARRRGFGAVAVQYGVGTYSALNAIAGAHRERVPLILISGSPSGPARRALLPWGLIFHHSTTPDMTTAQRIFAEVTAASVIVSDAARAPAAIDEVLLAALAQKLPVYLELWEDLWLAPCAPPAAPLQLPTPVTDPHALAAAVGDAMTRMRQARNPILWLGLEVAREGLTGQVRALRSAAGIPFATTLAAKAMIAETDPACIGTYVGAASAPEVRVAVESADCILALGPVLIDYYRSLVTTDYASTVLAADGSVRAGYAVYGPVQLADFIAALTRAIEADASFPRHCAATAPATPSVVDPAAPITYDAVFATLGDFLDESTALICDLGFGMFLSAPLRLKRDGGFLAQADWVSLGYALPAAIGVGLAERVRMVVVPGDGSFQMAPGALATLKAQNLPAIVVLPDNSTYGLEQAFTGLAAYQNDAPLTPYNVLRRWDYVLLAQSMGVPAERVETAAGLASALTAARQTDGPYLIQVALSDHDLPPAIAALVKSFGGH